MKRILIALMAGMTLAATMPAMATRHHVNTQKTSVSKSAMTHDAKAKSDSTAAVVAFSDTTDTDSDIDDNDSTYIANMPWSQMKEMRGMMNDALLPIALVFIIFFLAPVVIIALIVYLIIKSHNQKIKLAEIAMRNGQPIPEFLKKEEEDPQTKGLKYIFIGVGLFLALLIMGFNSLSGIGMFIMLYGCGQYAIANISRRKNNNNNASNNNASNNNASNNASQPYADNGASCSREHTADDANSRIKEEEKL